MCNCIQLTHAVTCLYNVQVFSVIMRFYYFLDRVLFHHDFHHDDFEYYENLYGHPFQFELHVEAFCNLAVLVLQMRKSLDVSTPGHSPWILDGTCYLRTSFCHGYIPYLDILQWSSRLCNWLSLRRLVPWINHLHLVCCSTFWKSSLKRK